MVLSFSPFPPRLKKKKKRERKKLFFFLFPPPWCRKSRKEGRSFIFFHSWWCWNKKEEHSKKKKEGFFSFSLLTGAENQERKVQREEFYLFPLLVLPKQGRKRWSFSLSFFSSFSFPLSLFLGFDKNHGEGAELTLWVALRNVKTSLEKTC